MVKEKIKEIKKDMKWKKKKKNKQLKISLKKIRPQNLQIRLDWLQNLKDIQRQQGDIPHLWHTIGMGTNDLSTLNKP